MQIKVNGELRETQAKNLEQLLGELNIPAPTVIIEHNRQIYKKESFSKCSLSEQDQIEIVRFAPGG